MAIVQGICTDFLVEKLKGTHNLLSDAIKFALYDSDLAELGPDTTAYTTTGEITGTGYTAGGATLAGIAISVIDRVVVVDFNEVTFANLLITADGALIYNDKAAGKPAIAVLKFLEPISSNNSTWRFDPPSPTKEQAILRFA